LVIKFPIYRQNLWWTTERWQEEDPDLKKWSAGVRWIPTILEKIELKPPAVHFLLGPRQVGKTTTLKLLISRLQAKPKSVFYYRCDRLADFRELDRVLGEYLALR